VAAPATTVAFATATNSPLQIDSAFGVKAGDFNGDGKPDLVITALADAYVFLGNGDGTFTAAPNSPMLLQSPPFTGASSVYAGPIGVGDFNNSGHLGLAIGEFQNQAVAILLGNGDGTFVASSAAFANAFGDPVSAVEAADFNADGNLDLVITNEYAGQQTVALGYGRGAFTTAGELYTGIFPVGAAVGDFNSDGKLDVVVASAGTQKYPGSGLNISLGRGDGTFTLASGSPIPLGSSLSAVVAGDFNGDGRLDLAVTDSVANSVTILLGNGDGTFVASSPIAVGTLPQALVADDFNADGKLDLAVANYGDGTVTLLLGNGDGTFTEASGSPYPTRAGAYQITTADFNGDGKLDLAVANMSDGSVSILLQQ
jgi:hypothetical protein